MVFPRSFKISLLLSALVHVGAFTALSQETVTSKLLASPTPVRVREEKPKTVRFELVETPASAKTLKPPKKANLFSDKNARAQDRFQGEKKLQDQPRLEGKHEDVHDTRPRNLVTKPPVVPAQQKQEPAKTEKTSEPEPSPKEAKPQKEPESKDIRSAAVPEEKKPAVKKEPPEPEKEIQVLSEPKNKEVIHIAKKSPAPSEPNPTRTPSVPSQMVAAASARNLGADAQITGELSFAATRHFFGEYLVKMKQAVERHWVSKLVTKYTGIVSSTVEIDFKIQPDGTVTDLVVNSSLGDPYFPVVCASSITDAQPFERIPYEEIEGLPEEYRDKPLNIRFTFRYR